jgi:hypothetical protein
MRATSRITRIWLTTWGLTLASVGCFSAESRTYALVSAMGDVLNAGHEVKRTGSHLPPYRNRPIEAPENILDKLALTSLDEVVAKMDPAGQRIRFSVALSKEMQSRPASLEEAAFHKAVEALRAMPGRDAWHRIVLVTPSMSGLERDGMGSRLQGMGIFIQALCQGELKFCDSGSQPESTGIKVETPSGETTTASRFVAPFLAMKMWILEPKTLAVLDSQEVFDHRKIWDPKSQALDPTKILDGKVLATRFVELVESSTRDAVMRSELRGTVDVKERGEVQDRRSP